MAPAWSLDVNTRVIPTQTTFEDRAALALESSGSWRIELLTEDPVDLFGFEGLSFVFHPARVALPEGSNPRMRGANVDLLEKVDLNLQQWQTVHLTIEDLNLPDRVPLQRLRFTGNIEGTFYLGDIRLVAQELPPNPGPTTVLEDHLDTTPDDFSLDQNYPNPFNSGTVIRFALQQRQEVELSIYNLAGQKVVQWVDGFHPPGTYTVNWDGRDQDELELASGIYFYRLQAGAQVETRKLLMLR